MFPQSVYDYTAHGDGGEWNLRRNRQAFDWVDLIPGKAVDPATVDLSSQLLDLNLKYPIVIAPTATQVALHPDGEAGMYRAAPAVVEHADVPQQQLEPVDRAGGERRAGTAVVAVLSAAGHGRQPGTARARAGRRLHGDGHHRRSAGVVLRAQPARSQSWRPHGRWRPWRWPRRRGGCGASGWRRARERSRSAGNGDDRPGRSGSRLGWRGTAPPASPSRRGRVSRWCRPPLVQLGIPRSGAEVHQDARSSSRASSPPRTRASASSVDSMASSCRITAADRWTTGRRRSKRCRRSLRR